MRDGMVEPVSRDQILRRERKKKKEETKNPCSAHHEQDWQPYRLIPNLLVHVMAKHTYIQTFWRRRKSTYLLS